MATIIICILLAVIVFLGIRSYRKKMVSGCCGSDSDAAPKKVRVEDQNLSHYPYEKVLKIDGMTCRNCFTHVQNALNSLDGVFSKADLDKKSAKVYMKEEIPDQLLRKAVLGAGYTVMSVSETRHRG
ncbi:cation transporter [Desulfosporosinus sp. SB140]|uniref:cation transporter n=1 Tax=Desulfosporosinus paludis TaxID=3115649 RepID=UPI00388E58B6